MDDQIMTLVKNCRVCQEARPSPPSAPLYPWEWPLEPWSGLHLDFAGPFMGHMFLVIADAHSKWLDVHLMQSITSVKTIETLKVVICYPWSSTQDCYGQWSYLYKRGISNILVTKWSCAYKNCPVPSVK